MRNFVYLVTVTVIAGVVLLIVEYGIFQNEEQPTSAVGFANEPQPEHENTQEISQKSKAQSGNPSQGLRPNSLNEAFLLALQIRSIVERDSTLVELVNASLVENDLPLAVKIADSIHSIITRDRTYIRIIDQALSNSDLQTAKLAMNKIFSIIDREAQLQKILQESVENE